MLYELCIATRTTDVTRVEQCCASVTFMSLIDTDLLYRTLDAHRAASGMSWRQVARKTWISASTFSRLQLGHPPGLDAYSEMCRWLGMPMETFSRRRSHGASSTLLSELAILLDRHAVPTTDQAVLMGMARAYLQSRGSSGN